MSVSHAAAVVIAATSAPLSLAQTSAKAAAAVALWGFGVAVAIAAQFISNLGSILQKKSHLLDEAQPSHKRKPYTHRGLWWLGMVLILIGSVADFVALTLAAQSIVATLGCLTLVAQVIWAPMILGERLSRRHYVSTGIIIAGVALAVGFGPHDESRYKTSAELLGRFFTTSFAIYGCLVVFICAVMLAAIRYVEVRFDLPPKPMLSDYLDDRTHVMHHGWGRYHRVAYGAVSGIIGGQVVLLGKFLGEALALTIRGASSLFHDPGTYGILLVLLTCVILQVHYLNMGVQRFQSLYVLPVFQAVWTLTSVVGGLIVLDEWSSISSPLFAALFITGTCVTLFGVYYLMNTPALNEDSRKAAATDLFGFSKPQTGSPTGRHSSCTACRRCCPPKPNSSTPTKSNFRAYTDGDDSDATRSPDLAGNERHPSTSTAGTVTAAVQQLAAKTSSVPSYLSLTPKPVVGKGSNGESYMRRRGGGEPSFLAATSSTSTSTSREVTEVVTAGKGKGNGGGASSSYPNGIPAHTVESEQMRGGATPTSGSAGTADNTASASAHTSSNGSSSGRDHHFVPDERRSGGYVGLEARSAAPFGAVATALSGVWSRAFPGTVTGTRHDDATPASVSTITAPPGVGQLSDIPSEPAQPFHWQPFTTSFTDELADVGEAARNPAQSLRPFT